MRIICASSEEVGVLFFGALQWDPDCEAQRTEYLCTANEKNSQKIVERNWMQTQ